MRYDVADDLKGSNLFSSVKERYIYFELLVLY